MSTDGLDDLRGIRVIDLSRIIAGPLCTQLLRDFGATVIKVERAPLGDAARSYVRGRVDGVAVSPLFASLNAGKYSAAIDIGTDEGRDLVTRLSVDADVFIHNFRPGLVERLGLGPETLMAKNPRLVYCAISAFGDVGPLRSKGGNDIAAQAYSGLMSITGEPNSRPIRSPVQVADFTSGYNAAVGVLAALAGRERSGRGSFVSTSLLESMVSLLGQFFTDYLITGVPLEPLGSGNRLGQPNQSFRTSDGYAVVSSINEAMWQRCANVLGHPEWIDDSRFRTVADRAANQVDLVAVMEAETTKHATADLVRLMDAGNVACAPILRIDETVEDEQVAALGIRTDVDYEGRPVPTFGSPLTFDGRRASRGAVPRLGEHTVAVLTELGLDEAAIRDLANREIVAVAGSEKNAL